MGKVGGHTLGQRARAFFNLREGRASHDTIRRRVVEGTRLDGIHLATLMVAMAIASVGLNSNSTGAVIGAMLICPLMGSVVALAYAVAAADRTLLRHAALALLAQMALCLATSTAYFLLSPVSIQTDALLDNAVPTIWDILIALAGGFAGAIGYSRRQEPPTLIAGVAVATALMPPLCAAGYGISMADGFFALTSLYKLGLNVVFIAFSAEVVFMALRVPLARDLAEDGAQDVRPRSSVRLKRMLAVGTILFAVPCVLVSLLVVHATNGLTDLSDLEELAREDDAGKAAGLVVQELGIVCPGFAGFELNAHAAYGTDASEGQTRTTATITTTAELAQEEREEAERLVRLHEPNVDEVAFVVADAPAG